MQIEDKKLIEFLMKLDLMTFEEPFEWILLYSVDWNLKQLSVSNASQLEHLALFTL